MNAAASSRLVSWFEDWREPLRRYLLMRRVGSRADVEDIAQEVFLRLIRYDRSDLISHPQAYLFKIAANVSAEWAVRSSRRLPHRAEWLEGLVDETDPASALERASRANAEATMLVSLEAVLDDLPPRSREIVRLRFDERLKYEDIAVRLGVSRRIVKRDLARAYAFIRVSLGNPAAAEPRRIQGRAANVRR